MNETKVYADGYFQSFAGEGDFLSFLKSRNILSSKSSNPDCNKHPVPVHITVIA